MTVNSLSREEVRKRVKEYQEEIAKEEKNMMCPLKEWCPFGHNCTTKKQDCKTWREHEKD